MFEEIVPYFTTSNLEQGFAVVGLLNLLLPTAAVEKGSKWQPQHYLPTFFHLGGLISRSKLVDMHMLDLFSRLARDNLSAAYVPFGEYGIFTDDQACYIFTSILRLLDIPVSQVTSPYSSGVDMWVGLASVLERDSRKHPLAHHIARWIVMSLSPSSATSPESVLSKLEGLIQAVETFFHPSNTGPWTKNLSQLVFYLADFFVMRWNRERSGEMPVPESRMLNDAVKRRFVMCLKDVTFMGIFAKSGTAMNYSLSSLQSLAYLEPNLILPGALQRIYPSLQGLVEVHRTTSSIRALHELTRTMIRTKGFRCHVTSLLGLALPGIDANDLDKTMYTLAYMQAVFYDMPLCDLTEQSQAEKDVGAGRLSSDDAVNWIQMQIGRLEQEGADIELNYEEELSDEDELALLRASTAAFKSFISTFFERVFNLLRNLPDASRVKSGSPEENITNTLPAMFTPLFASMSPELYDLALHKMADFVSNHIVYQARDAAAFICSVMCKANPKKALSVLIPIVIQGIRTEVEENAAGSQRTTGSEVLPRDHALVWNISLLSMSLVHCGNAILDFKDELLDTVQYLRQKVKGIPATHAANLIHHILLTLTMTYTIDLALYEESDVAGGINASHWGKLPDPQRLNIKWHYADKGEVEFAVKLFRTGADSEIQRLRHLISAESTIKRDGSGKDWSDEVSRSLVLIRLLLSGISSLFDSRYAVKQGLEQKTNDIDIDGQPAELRTAEDNDEDDDDDDLGAGDEDAVRPTFQYATGYHLSPGDGIYESLHESRAAIGETLHQVHKFLTEKQQDDVTSFNALYAAYRSWFTDVGIERSAHVLDRVSRLLVADTGHFKVSGLRKEYPRPLLVRRANVYHLQRLRHNASPRHKTDLDVKLLRDLVQSSVSYYTEIRRTAQTAGESTLKVMIGARPVVIPPLLEHFKQALNDTDFPKIKGAMFSLLFSSLTKSIARDWRYAPSLLLSYVRVLDVDKLSVQKIAGGASIQVMDMTRPQSKMAILEPKIVDALHPMKEADVQRQVDQLRSKISKRHDFILDQRTSLSGDLVDVAKASPWKKESRTAMIVIGLSLSFTKLAPDKMIDLVTEKAIDPHPTLRATYNSALIGLFTYIDLRAVSDHKYENYLLEVKKVPGFVRKEIDQSDPDLTSNYLKSFAQPNADLYIDNEYPGWLAWSKSMPGFVASEANTLDYDELEARIRSRIGAAIDRAWLSAYFGFLKQEPRDQNTDRFRTTNIISLTSIFNLILQQGAKATWDDLKDLIKTTFGDGTDKHAHRATAEILGGLLNAVIPLSHEIREMVWGHCFPLIRNVFQDGLTPENSGYWMTFLDYMIQNKDPRRIWPLISWLSRFRLNMASNAAFKESSKITLIEHTVDYLGWHYQLQEPIMADFLSHLDHPYKGVREVMGRVIAAVYRSRYHESHRDVSTLIEHEKSVSSVGSKSYTPSADLNNTVTTVFDQLESWRKERPAGQQEASSYTSGSKTVLHWIENSLCYQECTTLIPFFPTHFITSLLHMMDIKEDPELQSQAYSAFRHLGNIPFRKGEETPFVEACINIGRNATSWHQRLRIMINIQAIYFRHLFLMPVDRQKSLFNTVAAMLQDSQLEVRVGAQATLSGMIRCSPVALREDLIKSFTKQFTTLLSKNPAPKRGQGVTPTPEHSKTGLARHAAVLGLGALVQAFPYQSPPPEWVPGVLATLATKAAGDAGVVGKSAKGVVSEFKKTRQDSWHVDLKVCCSFFHSPVEVKGKRC